VRREDPGKAIFDGEPRSVGHHCQPYLTTSYLQLSLPSSLLHGQMNLMETERASREEE
jgi:hypothetical protein